MNQPLRHPVPASSMDHQAMPIEPTKRLAIELPAHERGRSQDDIKRLDILNRRIARPLPKGDKRAEKEREAHIAERDTLERRPLVVADGKWARAANDETTALAEARGETIAEDKSGVRRILDHDPLLSLARSDHLTPEQLDVGLEVRQLYDSRAQDAGAMEYTGMPGAAHDHERFIASRFTRAKASEFIGRIERAVAVHCSAEPACLVALRAVCERGWPMVSMGKGRLFERNCVAFARALDVADAVLRRRL